jgi:TPR repeat protein
MTDIYSSMNEWLDSADGGCKGAQYNIGMACKLGFPGFPRSKKQAFYWFNLAARNGSHHAMFELIECYTRGHGVGKNPTMATRWEDKLERSLAKLGRTL